MFSDHLLIAVGIVTTGPDCERDQIRELAAKLVVPPWLQRETFVSPTLFHSHVKTDRIRASVRKNWVRFEKEKEKENENEDEQRASCATVINDFLDWLQLVVREARRNTDSYLVTALVGHFAFWKDFKFLVRCCEDNCSSDMIGLWCQFADSGHLLCKLKTMNLWERNAKTDLPSVCPHLIGENLSKAASALHKAEALAKLLALPAFARHLEHLDLLTYQGFKSRCEKEESCERFFDDLMANLGPDLVRMELLRRMARKRVSFQHVQNAFWSCRSRNSFKTKMKKKHALDLDADEAGEVYDACKASSKAYNCCIHFANKMPNTTFQYK